MKQYLTIVECAIEHQGKFLVIKRPAGKHAEGLLSFPDGKVEEQDERDNFDIFRSAVKREVFEEVGLVLKDPINYITSSYFTDSNNVQIINSLFHCIIDKTELKIKASAREVPEYYWMNQEEINRAENAPEWFRIYTELVVKGK